MTRTFSLLAGCAIMAFSASTALADCAADLAQMTGETASAPPAGGGVSKDGSLAPLQTAPAQTGDAAPAADGAAAGGHDGSGEVAKDGSHAPLETNSTVATSAQDAQAQQEGGETAAAEAMAGAEDTPERAEALERARTALASGDEAACAAALEEARAH